MTHLKFGLHIQQIQMKENEFECSFLKSYALNVNSPDKVEEPIARIMNLNERKLIRMTIYLGDHKCREFEC